MILGAAGTANNGPLDANPMPRGTSSFVQFAVSAALQPRQAMTTGPRGGLGAAVDIELLGGVVDVVLERGELDRERPGDLLVREARLDQAQDLELARRQPPVDRLQPAL